MTFFEAARRLIREGCDAEFVVIGQGRSESALRRLAERLQIADRVTFAEEWTLGEAFWSVVDVYCQASPDAASGFELGVAMSHAVPVVASDVPGLRSWVRHGETGLQVLPSEVEELTMAIRRLLIDTELARRLGHCGREWIATECDPERQSDALATLYHEAMSETIDRLDPRPGAAVSGRA